MKIDATILTPATPSVQSSGVKSIPRRKWGRIYHAVVSISDISPQARARASPHPLQQERPPGAHSGDVWQ
jgi:hypothetical protein